MEIASLSNRDKPKPISYLLFRGEAVGRGHKAPRPEHVPSMLHTGRIGRANQLSLVCWVVSVGLLATACSGRQNVSAPPSDGGWREFQGTWTAAGTRHIMRLDGDRRASVLIV